MQAVDYDDRQHAVYARGRALAEGSADRWMAALAKRAPPRRPLSVLDLGCGIGRFTPSLAETFGGPVLGVEPSAKMREIAEHDAAHPAITYLAGRAEAIPAPAGSVDLALMFLSIHHVRDKAAAAAEIVRVLRPGGRLFVRSTFADRMPDLRWHHFFPRARKVEKQMFPRVLDLLDLFTPLGLRPISLDVVEETMAASLADYAARLRLRAISTFEHLTDQEIAEGFARLDAAVAAERTPTPIVSPCDLLVLG